MGWLQKGLRANMAQKAHRVGAHAGDDAPKEARKGPHWGGPRHLAWNHIGALCAEMGRELHLSGA